MSDSPTIPIYSPEQRIGKYSDIFPNSQAPMPILNDGRIRKINLAPKLPPIFQQGILGSCVSSSISTAKEYQEFIETNRTEQISQNGILLQSVVKKSTHYLHDQRLRETGCIIRTPITKTSSKENVVIGGNGVFDNGIEGMFDVVEVEYELKPGHRENAAGVIQVGLGFYRHNHKYGKFGQLNIGNENFHVVDNTTQYFFSRYTSDNFGPLLDNENSEDLVSFTWDSSSIPSRYKANGFEEDSRDKELFLKNE